MTDDKTRKYMDIYNKVWRICEEDMRAFSPGVDQGIVDIFLSQFDVRGTLVYDIGCGTGRNGVVIFEAGAEQVVFIDIADQELCMDPEICDRVVHVNDAVFYHSKKKPKLVFVQTAVWDLSEWLPPADYIYSADLLEHIPYDLLDASLREMSRRTRYGGLFGIAKTPATYTASRVGEKDLHLIQEPTNWWLGKLNLYWKDVRIAKEWSGRYGPRVEVFVGRGRDIK